MSDAEEILTRSAKDPEWFVREVLGEDPWPKQIEIMESVRDNRNTAVPACHSPGKCTPWDEPVLLASGEWVPAGELVGTTARLPSWDEATEQVVPRLATFSDNGVRPLHRVVLEGAPDVTRTGEHPLYAADRSGVQRGERHGPALLRLGWVPIEKLEPGMAIAVTETLPEPEDPVSVPEAERTLCAALIADGGLTNGTTYTKRPGPLRDEVFLAAQALGCGVMPYGTGDMAFGLPGAYVYTRRWGLYGKHSRMKEFPTFVWRLPSDELAHFLGVLLSGDGCVEGDARLSYSSASYRLIRDVRRAMLRLGIFGDIRERWTRPKKGAPRCQTWEWSTASFHAVRVAAERLPLIGPKADRLQVIARVGKKERRWQWDQAPPGFRWCKVKAVVPAGEAPTVAIGVDDTHTYVTETLEHNSWTAARIVLWFLYSFAPSKVITTAPTERQVKGILWGEIHRARRRAKYPLGGNPTSLRLEIEEDWWAWGFTAPDWDPNRFQGFHAPNILIVVDEACGIQQTMMEQIDSLLAGGHARKLEIGNPVLAGSPFEASCNSRLVSTLPISAFDTPNFTAFGITEADMVADTWRDKVNGAPMPRDELISPEWVAERLELWGPESNAWKARVKGEFPDVVEGAFYGEALKQAAAEGRIGDFPWDPTKPVYTAWDLGVRDRNAIWYFQPEGNFWNAIDYDEGSGFGLPHWVQTVKGKPYTYADHIAPHDIKQTDYGNGRSRVAVAADLGLAFRVLDKVVVRLGSVVAERIDAARRLLPRVRFNEPTVSEGLFALRSYHAKMDPSTGKSTGVPDHDWASHGADGFGHFAQGSQQMGTTNRPRPRTAWVT